MAVTEAERAARREFATRLNRLFATIRDENDEEYSNTEIGRRAEVSAPYIGYLRRELRNPPSNKVARRIERAFGLTTPYLLTDDAADVQIMDDKLAALQDMQDSGVWTLAMRARRLTPGGLAVVAEMIKYVEEREGVRPSDTSTTTET